MANPGAVTVGSPRFRSGKVDGCDVVHAWFPPGAVIDTHRHERPTVAIMLNGGFDLQFGARGFACPASTVAVEPASELHRNVIGSAGADVLVLQPDVSRGEAWLPFARFLNEISCRQHRGVTRIAARIVGELSNPDAFSPLALEAFGLEALLTAARLRRGTRGAERPPWLVRACEMMRDDPCTVRTVREIAAEVGVDPATLTRGFRGALGCSVGSFSRRARIEWVAVRLSITTDSIAAIAVCAGFADQSHMSRVFRHQVGCTPARYRREHT